MRRFGGVKVRLGVQKVSVYQGREQHPHPQGVATRQRRLLADIDGQVGERQLPLRHQGVGRRGAFQCLCQLALGVGRTQAGDQATFPVVQPCVMAGDHVLQRPCHQPALRSQPLGEHALGPECAGRRVGLVAVGNSGAGLLRRSAVAASLNVRLAAIGRADVALKSGSAFAQVVPQAGQSRDHGGSGKCERGCQFANRAKVIVQAVRQGARCASLGR